VVNTFWRRNGIRPVAKRNRKRRIDRVLGTILMGPGEVLVLMIITGVIVAVAVIRARMK